MTRASPGTIGRALFAYSVLGLAFTRAIANYVSVDIATGGFTYRVGDWVINYAGGFVRRGLFGELLFAVSPLGQSTLWALTGFQLACYAVVLGYVASFLHRSGYTWSAIALACGPALRGLGRAGRMAQGDHRLRGNRCARVVPAQGR